MPTLDMNGPYALTDNEINHRITRTSPGNYGLGYTNNEGVFIVQYVGRSDSDLNSRLHSWVGKKYKEFKYSYADNAKGAFNKECHNFHDFGGDKLDNDVHPGRPTSTNWKCPVCDC